MTPGGRLHKDDVVQLRLLADLAGKLRPASWPVPMVRAMMLRGLIPTSCAEYARQLDTKAEDVGSKANRELAGELLVKLVSQCLTWAPALVELLLPTLQLDGWKFAETEYPDGSQGLALTYKVHGRNGRMVETEALGIVDTAGRPLTAEVHMPALRFAELSTLLRRIALELDVCEEQTDDATQDEGPVC